MDDLIFRSAAIETMTADNLNRNLDSVHDDDMKRAARAAQRALARLPAAQRWIPVTEPPEKDGWYWVYAPEYKGGSSSGLKFIDGMMLSKFKSGRWSIEHGYYKRPGCVTHWMPLPEPPKEAQK